MGLLSFGFGKYEESFSINALNSEKLLFYKIYNFIFTVQIHIMLSCQFEKRNNFIKLLYKPFF